MTSTPIPSATRLALGFTMIIGGLQWSMDVPSVRDRFRAPLITLLWNRLARPTLRFAARGARAKPGALRPPEAAPHSA